MWVPPKQKYESQGPLTKGQMSPYILVDNYFNFNFFQGLDDSEEKTDKELNDEYEEDYFNKIPSPHTACWDLNKRGGVGETPFHILYLMDSPVHLEVARVLLEIFPNLCLDTYEGDEYYGQQSFIYTNYNTYKHILTDDRLKENVLQP